MNYTSIISCSTSDYRGVSAVVAVSGCSHACKGCWAKQAWKSSFGKVFDATSYEELYIAASKSYIDNVVIQGGDGLFHKNVNDTIKLCQRLRKDLPSKKIVLFTGYTLSEIQNDILRRSVLALIDVLVDGKYEKDNPATKTFRGSDNQVIYHLKNGKVTHSE